MRKAVIASLLVVVIAATAGLGNLIEETANKPPCDIAPQGSDLYVRATKTLTAAPVANAAVDAVPVETCRGIDTTIGILMKGTTNATGVARLDASFDTNLTLTVHYVGHDYPFRAYVQDAPATCADLNLPSGSLRVSPC